MRVLEGPHNEPWKIEARCTGEGNGRKGCGAWLEVEQGDVFNSNTYTRVFATFECPLCEAWTDIDRHKLWPTAYDDLMCYQRRKPEPDGIPDLLGRDLPRLRE